MVLGTPDYLAPEQIENAAGTDIRADLYGLGATLFYLLTGKAPFAHHDRARAKLKAQAAEAPPDVRSLRPEVPAGVAALVARLLAKRPEQRFATPREVADALDPFTAAAQPRSRRRKWFAIAAGVLLIPLVVWAAFYLMHRSPGNGSSAPPALQDDRLVLRIWSKDGTKKGLRIGVDPGALPARPDDQIRAEVRLNQPAYIYLLALSAQGEVTPLYPWHRDVPTLERTLNDPPPVVAPQTELTWPSLESAKGLPLDDKSGLETIVLLARRTPVPANPSLAELVGPLPLPAAALGHREEFVVRGGDEGQGVDAVRFALHRGFQKDLRDIDEPLEQLLGRLHGEFELLRAVRFAHQGR
jgi:hypothetical protein